MLVIATDGDSSGIGGGGEGESGQGSQGGDEHKLRGEENHVWQLKMKQSEVRPVAGVK